MKLLLLISTLILSSLDVLSQDYIQTYYPETYRAENLILTGDKIGAYNKYKYIIENFERVFAIDLHNAIMCGLEINADNDILFDWIKKLYILGVEDAYFQHKLISSIKDKALLTRINLELPYFKQEKIKQIDLSLRNQLENLALRDQKFRKEKDGYKLYKDSINQIDKENINQLIKIIKKRGFPSEQEAGIKKPGDIPIFYIVLHHHYQNNGNIQNNVKEANKNIWIIEQAVKEGKLMPRIASQYLGFVNSKDKRVNPMDYNLTTDIEVKQKIEMNRHSIGLPPINEYKKRLMLLANWSDKNYLLR